MCYCTLVVPTREADRRHRVRVFRTSLRLYDVIGTLVAGYAFAMPLVSPASCLSPVSTLCDGMSNVKYLKSLPGPQFWMHSTQSRPPGAQKNHPMWARLVGGGLQVNSSPVPRILPAWGPAAVLEFRVLLYSSLIQPDMAFVLYLSLHFPIKSSPPFSIS